MLQFNIIIVLFCFVEFFIPHRKRPRRQLLPVRGGSLCRVDPIRPPVRVRVLNPQQRDRLDQYPPVRVQSNGEEGHPRRRRLLFQARGHRELQKREGHAHKTVPRPWTTHRFYTACPRLIFTNKK